MSLTYYQANRERALANCRRYQAEHPEVVKRAQKKYRERHADKIRAQRKARWTREKERGALIHKAWVERNREKRAAYMHKWRAQKFKDRQVYDAAYRAANKEQRAAVQNARRARKIGNGGSHSKEQWDALKLEYGMCCAYCGSGGRMTKDHIDALVRGGSDNIENIAPACITCNRRKHRKTPEDFIDSLFGAA